MSLWFSTVRHLRPVQVYSRFTRRLPRRPHVPEPFLRPRTGAWTLPIEHHPHPLVQPSRLRDYTIHYHDRPSAELIHQWISENDHQQGPGWEPYPLSLRIVNWTKWFLNGNRPGHRELDSLCLQAAHLFRNLEYHLLGNHLFANAKALVFAGTFLVEPEWLNTGMAILQREIREQVLSDGGHFERSPMYHSLFLEDILDLENLSNLCWVVTSLAGGREDAWLVAKYAP